MSEEREKVYQILELGKHIKNLHHKKGFGGLLFIDLSMIKFSKLSSYIRQLDKENQALKKKYENAVADYETTMFEKEQLNSLVNSCQEEIRQLKKQLENCYCNRTDCSGRIKDSKVYDSLVQKVKTQQQEFIKYLEDEIKLINPNDLDIGELNLRLDDINFIQYLIYKEILQKYKEIGLK